MTPNSIVIIGAGHAGVQAAASLREEGWEGAITLLSDEAALPYQRPPLSKAFLKGQLDLAGLPLRAERFFHDNRIDLRRGEKALRIDRKSKRLELSWGGVAPYDHLILATGARQRVLRAPGVDLEGVISLRTIVDAQAIREGLGPGRRVVVIGAGFIGLEIAATALALGGDVTIVEIADRPLGRAVSPAMSSFFLQAHQAFGAKFRLGVDVTAIHGAAGCASDVELSSGEHLPADIVVVGVGVTAEDGLAREAGLDCANGIVVDEFLATSDPTISAIGDCAQFPSLILNAPLRLESVQNATDQARSLARRLLGRPERYDALPWFWSDQGDLKLQIAGLSHGVDRWVLRGDPATRAFATFGFRAGALAVAETVNRGAEHMAARRIIGGGMPLTSEQAADPQFDLRKLALGAKG
jgi:3-phenylpropionate/trans-cinnamate dioxygenase ferredoxin reductase component